MLALVLSRRNIREADQMVNLYTPQQGRLELMAKGVKKITSKNSGNLSPGALVEIEIAPGKEFFYLTKVQPVYLFKNIRQDLRKSLLLNYILGLVDKLTAVGQEDEQVFALLIDWLKFLDQTKTVKQGLMQSLLVKLLANFGFGLQLQNCVACGQVSEDMVVDIADGGLLCQACQSTARPQLAVLQPAQVAYLRNLAQADWSQILQQSDDEVVFNLINDFICYHSGKNIKKFNNVDYAGIN